MNVAALAVVVGCVFSAFAPGFNASFLHDSYYLVYLPSKQTASDILRLFYAHPVSGDFFFRPLAYAVFWLFSKWAAFDYIKWHLLCVTIHAVNCCLVFALAQRLKVTWTGALIAALMFGLAGSRPEAVTWVAARVDVLATLFVLLSLITTIDIAEGSGGQAAYTSLTIYAVAGLLSKESAFCLPLLAAAMLLTRPWTAKATRVVVVLAAVTTVMFVYRRWVLGSIGGYGAAAGHPEVLHFSAVRTLEALAFRMWGVLCIPVNWSISPGPFFWVGAVAAVGGVIWIASRGACTSRRLLLAFIAMAVAAALPAQHLMLIASDLNGARVYYLPGLGFALFCGAAIGGLPSRSARWVTGLGFMLFQTVALEHNLTIWREIARTGQEACRAFAGILQQEGLTDQPVTVRDLPSKRDGVFFLQNGFPLCVLMNSDLKTPPRVVENAPQVFEWDDAKARFERAR